MSTPIEPAAEELHERARRSLGAGDAAGARRILEQLVAMAPRQIPYWLSLAAVYRALGLRAEELSALERALALDATHPIVLLQKAAVLDLWASRKPRPRSTRTHCTRCRRVRGCRRPSMPTWLMQGGEWRENSAQLSAAIERRLTGFSRSAHAGAERMRFDRCLDRLLGRTRIYASDPTFMLFPFLINYEFFPREYFPWLESLEACRRTSAANCSPY